MRDRPHDRARRKHAPYKPQRGDHRGCERRVGRATTGATRQAPPPCRGTGAAPRACAVLVTCLRQRTDGEDAPPPPHPLLPHPPQKGARTARRRRGDTGGGGGGERTDRHARGRDGRRAVETQKKKEKQSKPTRQGKKAGRHRPIPQRTGGGRGDMSPQETLVRYPTSGVWGPQRRNPPPHCGQVPHPVLASCLRRACDMRATTGRRQGRPPPPPHTTAPPRVGEDGRGGRNADPPREQSGRVGRQRRGGAGRTTRPSPKGARAVQAPRGGPLGVRPQGRKGDDGSHTASPPPPTEGQVPRLVPAPCSRCAYARGQTARTPPHPPPSPPPTPERGEYSEETARGHGGGGRGHTETPGGETSGERWRCQAKDKKNKAHQRATARTGSRNRRDTAGTKKHGKGRGKGGHPRGRKLGGRDQHRSERGTGGVTRARK